MPLGPGIFTHSPEAMSSQASSTSRPTPSKGKAWQWELELCDDSRAGGLAGRNSMHSSLGTECCLDMSNRLRSR